MNTLSRRTVLHAAWSAPVIAAAIGAPAMAASTPPVDKYVLKCEKKPNHGHGGDTGNDWWEVYYSDGSFEVLDNGTVMSDPDLREICKKK